MRLFAIATLLTALLFASVACGGTEDDHEAPSGCHFEYRPGEANCLFEGRVPGYRPSTIERMCCGSETWADCAVTRVTEGSCIKK